MQGRWLISNQAKPVTIEARGTLPGLERSCKEDWVKSAPWQQGIQRIEAFFSGKAYAPHRHDTYSIGYTIHGVQSFAYRGEKNDSTPGHIIVLHPDEIHDGQAGSAEGFHYRMIYIEPSLIRNALGDHANALPFVKDAVFNDPLLRNAIHSSYFDMESPLEPIALDEIIQMLADGLLAKDPSATKSKSQLIDLKAVETARSFLDENYDQPISSIELETLTGQDRFSLARQFRKALGTSPHRYLIMRRLERARARIENGWPLADAAFASGFADQAHMTRQFKTNFGIPPGHWQKLNQRHARH